ncbi:uncharacterized protein MELLADRAFT_93828 [Melampsora larici-populina 98AG31]|uniref:ferroxidase n=1 Tax=Melampsora larici-populina (strain 98AG31 / pathotype 3-4-7) TaxID=747676 RepID=F4S5E5_MELLP|nr:uncharacterized protein MELLADRAFT_93828 [Melampsora larici-populina 98AG31]EGG00154.1 hypothetical protein MELLADRAFT_93828 [Melampsora larici-populina 98AG31]
MSPSKPKELPSSFSRPNLIEVFYWRPGFIDRYLIRELNIQEYHQISDETLHQLTESLEALIESGHPKVEGWDLDFSSGVLTFSMGEAGTYVINKQPPSKQIWFSSPISGPKRFDYDRELKIWFYARDDGRMMDLIRDEISNALGDDHFVKILDHRPKDEK